MSILESTEHKLESWCKGIIRKRSIDALRVLLDLLDAGLMRGYCTANDIKHRDMMESKLIGACFKVLPGMGFRIDRAQQVVCTNPKSHGRWIPKWILDDRWKADQAHLWIGDHILCSEPREAEQLLLQPQGSTQK